MKKGKKLECHGNLFWQSKNILACNFPFPLAIQIFYGVTIPHFGLPFGTWHSAVISRHELSINRSAPMSVCMSLLNVRLSVYQVVSLSLPVSGSLCLLFFCLYVFVHVCVCLCVSTYVGNTYVRVLYVCIYLCVCVLLPVEGILPFSILAP